MRPFVVVVAFAVLVAACAGESSGPRADARPGADAETIPPVDRATRSVDLEDVVFDTFGGGSVTLAEATPATIVRLLDAIAPLDLPHYDEAAAVDWLEPSDVVLAFIDADGAAWAYPTRLLDRHEIVNDRLAEVPVVVTYCPLCGSGVVYDRRVGTEELWFSNTSALHENDLVMVDRQSGSYWWQVAGEAIVGSRTGDRLTVLPSEMLRWGDWFARHPEGRVLARPEGRNYAGGLFAGYRERVSAGVTPFPVSAAALADDRLPSGAGVVVIELDGRSWAWPVDPPRSTDTVVGGIAVHVETDGTGGRVTRVDTGALLPGRTAMWFSVVSAFPGVELGPVG